MIDLGLARIGRLLQHAPPPAWKAIHVAGTNGKGSVCAYLSAMLHARGVPSARFTSPHFVDRWDCVVVDERPVPEQSFAAAEQAVLQRDRADQIGATEFELLTATAFDVFDKSLKSGGFGVVECGLGGTLDATTAMRAERAVTVVTRIGLDHQALLGNTAAAIAAHKAGIMRPGVPCIVDPANREDHAVRDVLEAQAKLVGAPLVYPDLGVLLEGTNGVSTSAVARLGLEPHQLTNLACAYAAFRIATSAAHADTESGYDSSESVSAVVNAEPDTEFLASIAQQLRWPGRLQTLDVGPLLKGSNDVNEQKAISVLLDGAHNPQSADALAVYVNKRLRGEDGNSTSSTVSKPITWILAASHGKDLDEILRPLLRAGDRVAAVTFGPVDGMPWVKPASPSSILKRATELGVSPSEQHSSQADTDGDTIHDPNSLVDALEWATANGAGTDSPIVIAGSLYLVSDTLRLLRQAGGEIGLP